MKVKFCQFTALLFIFSLTISCAIEEKTLSTENTMLSLIITKGNVSKEFTISENLISGKVNSDFDLNQINLTVLIPKGATISPDPTTITSITGPFTFTITA